MSNEHNDKLLEDLYHKYLSQGYTPIVAAELAKREFEEIAQ